MAASINKKRVLFLCIHNSARSQMAEAYLRYFAADRFDVFSAGLEAGKLNPVVVDVMKQNGIDLSTHYAKSVFDMHQQGMSFDFVITVCDAANADKCPVFPGPHQKIAWMFDDPSTFIGDPQEKLTFIAKVRDQIKQAVLQFIQDQG